MSEPLTDVDIRVLGSLIEKERTTPEYYPLSLNALVTACNQSSNRDPVVDFDEGTVARSIEALRQRGLIRSTKLVDARVPKYAHRMADVMGVNAEELAILCVLMLRGAQTPGELRTRTSRLATFEDLASIEAVLDRLIVRELVVRFPRQPGQKEVRYGHLLSGTITTEGSIASQTAMLPMEIPGALAPAETEVDRLAALEKTVDELKKELADLRAQVSAFRAQFE